MASEHIHELAWDYVYGLLDQTEAENLRAHVEICPQCRSALSEAQGQQQLLARAARVIHEVAAFTLPGQDLESAPPAAAAHATTAGEAPRTGNLPVPAPAPRRSALRRYWPALAAAAAALLGVALGVNEYYQDELYRRETHVARAREEVETADGLFAALQANLAREKRDRASLLIEQTPPQLNVLAPAQVYPDTPANIRVATRDQDGKPRAAEITTSILEPASGLVLQKQVDRIEGEGTVQVPGLKTGTQARLQVEAKAGMGDAKVEESLSVAEPTHVSHVALNKSTYFIGENLFFRTLTLDRFSLKPPATPINLRFTLVDVTGKVVREMTGETGQGGICPGEWALDTDLVSGKYTFQVAARDATNTHVLPQQRTLEIVRGEIPQIEFDRNQYKPGDTIGFNFRAGGQPGNNSYANKDVNITVNADGQAVAQAANSALNQARAQNSARLDNDGNLNNYQLQLPPQIKNGAELIIDMKDGKVDNKLVQVIPVVSSERTIDFFPEGGDLVAGLPNRVYYRVRSPLGESVDTEGHVSVLAGKVVVHDSERRRGLGAFTFTPDPKETYSVRITGSQGVTEIRDPFKKLGIQAQGLVLHAPQSVDREGEPLALVLRIQGPARRLLLHTTCRGQIVDQQYLDLQPGSHAVQVKPAPGAAGILRVTALDASTGSLVPVAERLLYRVPAKWLDVSCEIANGPGPYPVGTKGITMNLKAADEQKIAGPVWMLAAVVDEKYRVDKNERGLAAHFYLAGELGGEELDNANLVLNDAPASWQALDLFLGTQGWRRFVRGATPTLLALNEVNQSKGAPNGAAAPAAAFFSLQNATTQNLQANYQAALQKEVSELIDRANRERANLIDQRDGSVQKLSQAVRELAEFQQLPGVTLRLGLGILTLGLLAGSGLLLTVGLVRLVRKRANNATVCFGGAFACLFACLVLYLTAAPMTVGIDGGTEAQAAVRDVPWPQFTLGNVKVAGAITQPAPPPASPPLGYFVAQAGTSIEERQKPPQSTAERASGARGAGPSGENAAKRSEVTLARAQSLGVNQAQNKGVADPQRQLQEAVKGNDELQRRFLQNSSKAKEQVSGPQTPFAKPSGGGGGGGFGGAMKPGAQTNTGNYDYFREYAHRGIRQPGQLDVQDTLLWSPVRFTPDGQAQISFDLSQNLTTYRILVYANSPSGRLGFYEGRLETRPAAKK